MSTIDARWEPAVVRGVMRTLRDLAAGECGADCWRYFTLKGRP